MKKIFTLLTLGIFSFGIAQISTTRMNEMRLNNTLQQVEKALGKKLEITKTGDDWLFYVKVSEKGADFTLGFLESINESNSKELVLYEIKTNSSEIKTLSKLGVGSSIDDLWKAYKNYNISVWQMWDEIEDSNSKTDRVFNIQDHDAGTSLYFYLRNNKVYEIVIGVYEGC
ncbi:hypothetical protein [Moheibacter stercoris]|uniref:Beta-lactamase-inhibitor-like, PepSY-like n=1 Tax=Moheibacter stercoris TaxID=1628251 RepID=A0ABV2LV45_9FLAO